MSDKTNDQRDYLAANYPTLRDQFAMSVIGSLLEISRFNHKAIAKEAYAIADAMLEARQD